MTSATITTTISLKGLEGEIIHCFAQLRKGFLEIEGLDERGRRETRIRVQEALKTLEDSGSGALVSVHGKDRGACFDLAVAAAILGAKRKIQPEGLKDVVLIGELALTGQVRTVRGLIPMLQTAARKGYKRAIVPVDQAGEAAVVSGIEVTPICHLLELSSALGGDISPVPYQDGREAPKPMWDMSDIKGLAKGRRALEIAALGGHSILFIGPPGVGATMLSQRLTSLLPEMTPGDHLSTASVHSAAGLTRDGAPSSARPFRAPHHTVSDASLLGGGNPYRPGEVSLAHNGVLLLDGVMDFRSRQLERLMRIKDQGEVIVGGAVAYPASFQLVGTVSPCPCGYHGSKKRKCCCSDKLRERYLARLKPLLKLFDMHVDLTGPQGDKKGESSAEITERLGVARMLRRRMIPSDRNTTGARILGVAASIAAIEMERDTREEHLSEALSYRL